MATVKTTLAQARKAARVDIAKLKATTQADIEHQAHEDGTDDFSPFPPVAAEAKHFFTLQPPHSPE